METNVPQPLSENGSFESIVNSATRMARKQSAMWIHKSLRTIVVMMALFLVNVLLWMLRLIPSIPAVYVAEILTCAGAFVAGRVYEKIYR